ncbi:hypothetical protein DAMA08_042780 [Martiniozyma asiatica (nom. inval.)]|nr:hypothetical protein DAMA08_027090 [Martiniozyma asiatica]GMM31533.1 hypothetical protein DAMA08_042780 [Martiniozyma asiatica]
MVPTLVIILIGYKIWVYNYVYCHLIFLNIKFAISLQIISLLLLSSFIICWISLSYRAATSLKLKYEIPVLNLHEWAIQGQNFKNGKLDQLIKHPNKLPVKFYHSDVNGLPFYCKQCKSLKSILRHHHSNIRIPFKFFWKWLDNFILKGSIFENDSVCVPLFDHQCGILGATISGKNFIDFLLCAIMGMFYTWFCWITLIIGVEKWGTTKWLTPIVIELVFEGILGILLLNFLFNLIYGIHNGMTLLEVLQLKTQEKWITGVFKLHGDIELLGVVEIKNRIKIKSPVGLKNRIYNWFSNSIQKSENKQLIRYPHKRNVANQLQLWWKIRNFNFESNLEEIYDLDKVSWNDDIEQIFLSEIARGNYKVFVG